MKNKNLISIAMATYNGAMFLEDQLDSIFNQTHKNFEFLVFDDCSTDNTVNILNKYKKNHSQMRVNQNKKNIGYLKNFLQAANKANGEYIVFADQDDIWEKDKIETLLKNIKNHSMVFSDASLIDENGNFLHKSYIKYAKRRVKYLDLKYFLFRNIALGCTMMIKKDLLNYAIPFPQARDIFPHDWWLSIAAICQNGIKYIDKPLLRYRQHNRNVSGAGERGDNKLNLKSILNRDTRKKVFTCRKKRVEYILNSSLQLTKKDKKFLEKWIKISDNKLNIIQSFFLEINILITMIKLRK